MCEEATNNFKLIGIWMSEKKFQKLKWLEFVSICRIRGYEPVKLDLDRPLEDQGNIRVFVHKLTDIITAADQGDVKCQELIGNVEQYISNHPNMTVLDNLDSVRLLLDRYRYYSLISGHAQLRKHGIVMPLFCVLRDGARDLEARGVTFPLVCKPLVAHGSKSAHSMCVVFNAAGLTRLRPPCVVQSFVNHNALLYKIFLVGNRYCVAERPSLKNFYACSEREPIYFHSGDVCKADSQSTLSILDPQDAEEHRPYSLDLARVEVILRALRKELRLMLFGVDIVVDNTTDQYTIIDINVYPGYESFPNFLDHLVDTIVEITNAKNNSILTNGTNLENSYESHPKAWDDTFNGDTLINVGNANIDSFSKNILKETNDISHLRDG